MTEGNRRNRGKKRRRTCRNNSDTSEQRPLSAVSQVCEQNGLQNMGTDDVRMYQLASADQMNRFAQKYFNNNNSVWDNCNRARVDDMDYNELQNLHDKIQQEFITNGPRLEFYIRWPRHVIFYAMYDLWSANANAQVRCLMMLSGMVTGGLAVYIVRYILEKMVYYIPSLLIYLIDAIVIMNGPALLPPLTLVNGMASFIDRVKWCGLFMLVNYYILPYVSEVFKLPLISCYDMIIIISGIWHFDQGDLRYKRFNWYAEQRRDYFLTKENVDQVTFNWNGNYWEIGTGIAMVYTGGIGVYTYKAFFYVLVVYFAIQICIWRYMVMFAWQKVSL